MKPLIASAVFGIILMLASLFLRKKQSATQLATFLLLALLGINAWDLYEVLKVTGPQAYFNEMLQYDSFALWFSTLASGISLLYVLLCGKHIEKVGQHVGEYYALILFMLCGVNLLSAYGNLLILFLGIEVLSIPQYVLAGSDKRNSKSSEAALKYLLMGAFSTGILLMGICLLYGATGTFQVNAFDFVQTHTVNALSLSGIILIIIAIGFKASAAPMHFWTPDVYDGAPTPFAAYMATVVKVTVFVAFLRLFMHAFGSIHESWSTVVMVITALTLLIGNITALFQQSVKRMLAYSSIAQAGFMLFAILSINAMGMKGIIIYSVAYSVATIGMFAVLMKLKDYTYDGFNGLAKKEPLLAFAATIFLLSLAGIPITGGFFAKFYMLNALMSEQGMGLLIVFALLMAAVSVYYYFKVIMAMYFKTGDTEMSTTVSSQDKFLLVVACFIILLTGVAPELLLAWL